jgi:alanine racemase
LTIDMRAIAHNARALRGAVRESARLMAVVKANAYGHGDIATAKTALANGCDCLAVAFAQEGALLRDAGISAPILILGTPEPETLRDVVELDLQQTAFLPEHIRMLEDAASRAGKRASVHIKIDTGMSRIGVAGGALDELARAALDSRLVCVKGAYTHFAAADGDGADDEAFTRDQIDAFQKAALPLRRMFPHIMLHASNSAAALRYPEAAFDCVRVGIALYGAPPVSTAVPLRQAMRWSTRASYIKEIGGGACVGYGRTFRASGRTRVMTLPVGYADGYHRALSNRGFVLIRGRRAPLVGRVCMDQCMADITEIPEAEIGDEVVLLGAQREDAIGADELGAWAGTISYEIFCAPSERVPRVVIPDA